MLKTLINKIGQRNFSKILVLISFLSSILYFYIKELKERESLFYNPFLTPLSLVITTALKGILLLLIPHIILMLISNKSKEYRLKSIYTSMLFLIINIILLFLGYVNTLFIFIIIQTILSIIIYRIIIIKENKKRDLLIKKKKVEKDSIDENNDTN